MFKRRRNFPPIIFFAPSVAPGMCQIRTLRTVEGCGFPFLRLMSLCFAPGTFSVRSQSVCSP